MNNYYVYEHFDPQTRDVVYIGKGCNGRAWDVTRCRGQHKEHQEWMLSLCSNGYIPTDWVRIVETRLSEKDALDLEHARINRGCPIFNRQSGDKQHQAKLTNKQAIEIYDIARAKTTYHKDIAARYGVSRTCVSMIAAVKQWKAVLNPHIRATYENRT